MRARDERQRYELEFGGAILSLLERGYSVYRIARALEMDVRTARKLAGRYLMRVQALAECQRVEGGSVSDH